MAADRESPHSAVPRSAKCLHTVAGWRRKRPQPESPTVPGAYSPQFTVIEYAAKRSLPRSRTTAIAEPPPELQSAVTGPGRSSGGAKARGLRLANAKARIESVSRASPALV